MSESLKGKVAVVTGAASGIGLATTKLLIEADVKVFMVDWDEKTVREKAKDLGENAIPQITNLLDEESCAAMKNVHSIIPHMKQRGIGDIVITCSVAGHAAIQWEPVYSGSKWAMTCFVQTMRRQLMGNGIRVSQVSPGPVVSALLADWPQERLQKAKDNGALIDPEEVADAVIYMLTRKRNVTIRDMIVLPTNFDI